MKTDKQLTADMQSKVNRLYGYLYEKKDYCTKTQLMCFMQITSERAIREIMSVLAKKVPIISTSDKKGYKLAINESDLELVEHTWAEISSRVEELQKRIAPLAKFRDKHKYNI